MYVEAFKWNRHNTVDRALIAADTGTLNYPIRLSRAVQERFRHVLEP
jgi:hypothetical protein